MSALLPARPAVDEGQHEPTMIGLEDDEAESVFGALASRTARRVIARLYDDPATASDVADAVGISLQNATYHLSRLREADLVTVAGTWYSSRGVEMKVYAPTSDPLLLVAGADHFDALADVSDPADRSEDVG